MNHHLIRLLLTLSAVLLLLAPTRGLSQTLFDDEPPADGQPGDALPGPDLPGPGLSGDEADDKKPVVLSIHSSKQRVRPGDQFIIAVRATISEEPDADGKTWHIYPPAKLHEGDEIASTFKPTVPDGFVIGKVQWPKPKPALNALGEMQPAYGGVQHVYLPVIVPQDIEPGDYTFKVDFGYQACRAVCLFPTTKTLELTLQVVAKDAEVQGADVDSETFAGFDATVWAPLLKGEGVYEEDKAQATTLDLYFTTVNLDELGPVALVALLFGVALFGGFLLNFTPCVLPVIPIKIMGLSASAGSRGKMLVLGSFMFMGVLAFWGVFGIFFAFLKQFSSVSALFQEWWFTIGVGVVVAAMAVGMCGLFSVKLPNWVYAINPKHDSLHGSFGFGIMTAILATPCTAPFMGTALAGSTQLEQDWLVMAVFIAIGVGMGLPYLVLAAFPRLVEKMPRSGPGSELLKQVMGLLMLAAAAFFIGTGLNVVFSDGTAAPSKAFWWVVGALIVAAGAWLAFKTNKINPTLGKRITFTVIGLLFVGSGAVGSYALTRKPPIQWVYYTPQALQTALDKDKVVVLDFTAEWCGNCIALEKGVLNPKPVSDMLNDDRVVAMKVDITSNSNTAGLELLNQMGAKQIPLLVVLGPDGKQVFKRDWYKAADVVDAINKAKAIKSASRGGVAPE